MLISILLTAASALMLADATPTRNHTARASNTTATVPVTIRECFIQQYPASNMDQLAAYLATQPATTIRQNMGRAVFQHAIDDGNSTCMQVQVYNWSCDHDLAVTGPGLANAVQSIAQQCDGYTYSTGEVAGPAGFGYYRDVATGDDFTQHLWVLASLCNDGTIKSACSPGA